MLLTKIHIPATSQGLVFRPNLFEKLNTGLSRKLILISAPAGYGKTTIVTEWIEKNKIPTAWFSIDTRDNDPYEFFAFVICSIQKIHENIGKNSLELLNPPGTVGIDYIIELLINDLLKIEKDLLLVLDDFHLINNEQVISIISFLLEFKPKHFHVAILTRSDPAIPISRFRSQNEIIEIRSSDLSFSESDISELFNKKLNLDLTPKDIQLLEAKTEGWIAGLQLTALTIRDKKNKSEYIEKIAGDNRYIMDYLMEEVLNIQDDEMRTFLLFTSILEKLNGSLCNSVLEKNNCQLLLESLEKNNMFLISLDNERQWFRYHHLFRDLLKQRLILTNKELIPELHNKAGIWFEANDMPLLAIEHALEVGNIQKGFELIEKTIDYLVETSQYSLILKYAGLFSEKDIISNIKFGIIYAWTLTVTGSLKQAEKYLNKLKRKINSDGVHNEAKGIIGRMYITFNLLYDFMGEVENAFKYSELAIKYTVKDDIVWNSWAQYSMAGSHLLRFELDESIRSLSMGWEYAKKINNHYLEISHAPKIAYLLRLKGRYSEALNICNDLLEKFNSETNVEGFKLNLFSSVLYSTIGLILVERDKIRAGIEMVLKGYRLSQNLASISFKGYTSLLLAEAYYKAGDIKNALDIIEKIEPDLLKNVKHWLSVLSFALRLKLLSLMGVEEQAESFYNQVIKPGKNHYFEYCMYSIATARFFIVTGRYDEASFILEELSPVLKNKKIIELFVEVELMKVKIFILRGNKEDAINCIMNSLIITQDEGFIRMYLNEGKDIELILKEIKREKSTRLLDSISNDYLNEVLDAYSRENRIKKHTEDEILSNRELDTLKLIAENYSNQEICETLYISLSTVKTHVSNILLKLEAKNRIEATEIAKEKGLI